MLNVHVWCWVVIGHEKFRPQPSLYRNIAVTVLHYYTSTLCWFLWGMFSGARPTSCHWCLFPTLLYTFPLQSWLIKFQIIKKKKEINFIVIKFIHICTVPGHGITFLFSLCKIFLIYVNHHPHAIFPMW